jgi:rhodanese-related sulfurtransferase
MNWLARLTVNQRLAVAALLLGAVALFASPTPGPTVSIHPRELAAIVQRGGDRVAPTDLAGWIIEGRSDYRLVDLRDEAEYNRYHIPTAENIPLTSLTRDDFAPTDKVLLYSDDGARSAQGWFLLRATGFKGAYLLTGGIDGWKQAVLFPVLAEGADQASNAKVQAVSRHFGGVPRVGAQGVAPGAAPVLPEMDQSKLPPPPAAVTGGARPKAKKKEGC